MHNCYNYDLIHFLQSSNWASASYLFNGIKFGVTLKYYFISFLFKKN